MHRLAKFIGIFIYFFVLITSFYHVFKFYEVFEAAGESFVAFFVAIGFELSVLYFAYIYTKFKFPASKYALGLSLFIVWFGNIFVMASNVHDKTFAISFLNFEGVKFILAAIGSVFLPVSSFFLGRILANIDTLREQKKACTEPDKKLYESVQDIVQKPTMEDMGETHEEAEGFVVEEDEPLPLLLPEDEPVQITTEVSAVAKSVPAEVTTEVSAVAQENKVIPTELSVAYETEKPAAIPPYIQAQDATVTKPTTSKLRQKLGQLLG